MNRMIKTAIATALCMAMASSVQAKTVLKLAHVAPSDDTQQQAAEFFADKVTEYSNGELGIKIFGGGVLGNDQQLISSVRAGSVDMELSGNPNFTGLVPKLGVFDLPYIFADREQAYKVLDGAVGQDALALLDEHGLKGLAFWEVGFRAMTNNKHPIKQPADVKGLKMRTNSNKQLIEYFQLLGANTVPMPLGELYTALETGTVDAQDHPISIVYSAKLYEVQDYLSLTNQAYTALILAMNKGKFDALSEGGQEALLRAAREAAVYQRQLNQDAEVSIIADLRKEGVEVSENVDLAAFQAKAKPVWQSYIDQNGTEMIDRVEQVIAP